MKSPYKFYSFSCTIIILSSNRNGFVTQSHFPYGHSPVSSSKKVKLSLCLIIKQYALKTSGSGSIAPPFLNSDWGERH
jgi:hypothetical protein